MSSGMIAYTGSTRSGWGRTYWRRNQGQGIGLHPTPKTAPGESLSMRDGRTVTVSSVRPSGSKAAYNFHDGTIGDRKYNIQLQGYNPPIGTAVYMEPQSLWLYLPPIYIFSSNLLAERSVVAIEPNGSEYHTAIQHTGFDWYLLTSWLICVIVPMSLVIFYVRRIRKRKNSSN